MFPSISLFVIVQGIVSGLLDSITKMQEDFKKYCLDDAEWCYRLWEKWNELWPAEEQEFSQIIRARSLAGIAVDTDRLAQVKSVLKFRVREAREQIPWDDPPLSRQKLVRWCERQRGAPTGLDG